MLPDLIMHNANIADVMPCGPVHVTNRHDIMHSSCDMHMPASWVSLPCLYNERARLHNGFNAYIQY